MKKFSAVFVIGIVMSAVTWAAVGALAPRVAWADDGVPAQVGKGLPQEPAEVVETQPATTAPAPAGEVSSRAAASQPAGIADLRETAMECVQSGKFAEGLAKFRAAAKLDPADTSLDSSVKLLEAFVTRDQTWQGQRDAEFAQVARRVRLCMIAQAYLPTLAKDGVEKKLRQKMDEVLKSHGHATSVENLETASPEKAAELKAQVAEAFKKGSAALAAAVELLKGDTSDYADAFRELARQYSEDLDAYQKAWAAVNTSTARDVRLGAKTLRPLEDNLIDVLEPLEGMVAEQPWRSGLYQARLAKAIAPDKDLGQFDWYRDLLTDMKARGEAAVKDANWSDALNVYASLNDLEPDNADFKAQMKIARLHVRVLGLYGNVEENVARMGELHLDPNNPLMLHLKGDPNYVKLFGDPNLPATKPAKEQNPDIIVPKSMDDQGEEETRWKDLVEGVDADMVMAVIAEVDEYYVTAVDYRKLADGALMSIKVLAETPQSAYSFPALADEKKRDAFLKDIQGEIDGINQRDRVDYMSLQLAFNSILRESEQTVNIPVAVLAVEFCDGMLDELDKFSAMIWPHDVDEFSKQTMGHFQGVGIQISKEPGEPLRVVAPLPDTPAYREGIKTGDIILAVDGKRTEPLSVEKLVRMITGPKGTKVVLTVKSPGMEPRDMTLVREEIQIRTVKGWRRENGGDGDQWDFLIDPNDKIGYIRLTQFTEQSPGDIDRALETLKSQGVHSVVLDLRSNPGGLLEAAQKIAGEFITSGRIVSTRGRQKEQKDYDAAGGGRYTQGDLVVLVNDLSASAAEIVSGALSDWHRGIIVGQRTYGKGSVQNVIQVPKHPRAYLKLTTAHYYLPSGRCLHRENGDKKWGVDPDVEVLMTPRQTKTLLDLRRKTELLQDYDPNELAGELKEQYDDDMQLDAAVLLLRLKQLQSPATGS